MNVVWRARARADLAAIVWHVSQDSPAAARRLNEQILHSISFLLDWPEMGRMGRRRDVRELVVPQTPYLVIYRRERGKIFIQRIWHTSRKR